MSESLTNQIVSFVERVVGAMGAQLTATVEETADGTRINLQGEDGGILIRRGGEGLQALAHEDPARARRTAGDVDRADELVGIGRVVRDRLLADVVDRLAEAGAAGPGLLGELPAGAVGDPAPRHAQWIGPTWSLMPKGRSSST